jgi:hypothetical protein
VGKVETRHRLVRDFGVEADHVWMVEGLNESQSVADRRQVNISPWLVRLGLEREPVAIALRDRVLAQEIQRVTIPA